MPTDLQSEIVKNVIARGREALVSAVQEPGWKWPASTSVEEYAKKCLATVGYLTEAGQDPLDRAFSVGATSEGIKFFKAPESPIQGFPTTDDHRQGELMEILGETEYGVLWGTLHDWYHGVDEDQTASVVLCRDVAASRAIPAWMVSKGMPLYKMPGRYVDSVIVGETSTCISVSNPLTATIDTYHVMNADPVYPIFAPNRVVGVDTEAGDKMIAYLQHSG